MDLVAEDLGELDATVTELAQTLAMSSSGLEEGVVGQTRYRASGASARPSRR